MNIVPVHAGLAGSPPLKEKVSWGPGSIKSLEQGPASAQRIAAAHSAQLDATIAAVRADYDAKVAELMAELESARGEKEKAETNLALLKASARKERLHWNRDRTLLNRKVGEAEARARDAEDGLASPHEFIALQRELAEREVTIDELRKSLEDKEAHQGKMQFEMACASTAEADVDRLMIRLASLEQDLVQEEESRKSAEQEAEAKRAEARGFERRLAAALEGSSRAEADAAAHVEEVRKVSTEMREARAAQRHAELWLERSLAEVDAVHAMLQYERSLMGGPPGTAYHSADTSATTPTAQSRSHTFNVSMQTPLPQSELRSFGTSGQASWPRDRHALFAAAIETPQPRERPPSPAYGGADRTVMNRYTSAEREGRPMAVGPTEQTPAPETPTALLGATTSVAERTSLSPASQRSGPRTPELDATRPVKFSNTRLRSRVRGAGRRTDLEGYVEADTVSATRGECARDSAAFSPLTPTVLFGELAVDGQCTTWGRHATMEEKSETPKHRVQGVQKGSSIAPPVTGHTSNATTLVETDSTEEFRTTRERSMLSQLRAESRRLEEAEKRIKELEAAAADKGTGNHPVHPDPGGNDSSPYPCVRMHACVPDSGSKSHDIFAKIEGDTERDAILDLVMEARQRMQTSRSSSGSSRDGEGNDNGFVPGGWQRESGARNGHTFPVNGRGWRGLNPAGEVFSLIQQFEGKLQESSKDIIQLKDFCTHLESLLAAHAERK